MERGDFYGMRSMSHGYIYGSVWEVVSYRGHDHANYLNTKMKHGFISATNGKGLVDFFSSFSPLSISYEKLLNCHLNMQTRGCEHGRAAPIE